MSRSSIFIGEYQNVADGRVRLAVKDNIDVEGTPTTAGSAALARYGAATRDAPVVAQLREQPVAIVGKTNLDELAAGATGINEWYGTVPNPLDPTRISGGSSSGSAAAVALGHADIALGTDTGGSIRIPAALCGIAGLKPTTGLLSTAGVYPLSQRLDVVGPFAKDLPGLHRFMRWLLPQEKEQTSLRLEKIGRIRFPEEETVVDTVIDTELNSWGVKIEDIELPDWFAALNTAHTILSHQAWNNNRELLETNPERIGKAATEVLRHGEKIGVAEFADSLAFAAQWTQRICDLLGEFDALACPTVSRLAPTPAEHAQIPRGSFTRTMPFNLSGHPAVSVPLDVPGSPLRAGLQIVAAYGSDLPLLTELHEHISNTG